MIQGKRSERVGELIQSEISRLLLREVKDPRIGFVTLTAVEMSDDLRHAKVYVSSLGDEETKRTVLEGLRSCAGFLRGRLGRQLTLRYVPELHFHWDESIAHGVKIARLLDDLKDHPEPGSPEPLKEVAELLRNRESFVVTSHVDADGDAIGAQLGLGLFLQRWGRQVAMKHVQPVPQTYRFLPGADRIEVCDVNRESYQVGILVDCGDLARCGSLFQEKQWIGTFLNIDHHESNGGFADYNLVDVRAAASSELVYRLITELDPDGSLGEDIATNLLTGILVDTGSFHYGNTTPEVLRIAADLVEHGASPARITRELYERRSLAQLRLLGQSLLTIEQSHDSKVAIMVVTQEMIEKAGAGPNDTEDLVNFPGSLAGVEVALLLKQRSESRYKVSLRAKDTVNMAAVAERFGGGGHPNAAGCQIEGSLEEAKKQLLSILEEFL